MSSRNNVTSWSDCEAINRMTHTLQDELMKWQKYSYPSDSGRTGMGGDQMVLVAAINLRDRLEKLIERSKNANTVA